jgi:orotate phosphoribosyltransferase
MMAQDDLENIAKIIAHKALEIGAIKLNPDNPFTWASGFRMPIYNDNRMFLFYPVQRNIIAAGFQNLLRQEIGAFNIGYDVIAGTSTAGISPATTLADGEHAPLIYIRDKPKDHGLKNQIEGLDANSDLGGKKVVLIEDLISTGGSSAQAVQAIRNANGQCNYCFSIFNYDLDKGVEAFASLNPPCKVRSILNYDALLKIAKEINYISSAQQEMLAEWRIDPFGWGEKHGFPKVEKEKK